MDQIGQSSFWNVVLFAERFLVELKFRQASLDGPAKRCD
jgi:hypothetical protein